MTKTLDSIAYSVLEILTSFNITDDVDIPLDYLRNLAINVNKSIMRDDIDSGYRLDQFYSEITREIKEVSAITQVIGGISFESPKKMYYVDLPELLTGVTIGESDIRYFGSGDFSVEFSRKSLSAFNASKGSYMTQHMPIYTVVGSVAYVKRLPDSIARAIKAVCLLADQRDEDGFDNASTLFKTTSPFKLEMLMLKHVGFAFSIPADKIDDAQSALRAQYERQPISNAKGD